MPPFERIVADYDSSRVSPCPTKSEPREDLVQQIFLAVWRTCPRIAPTLRRPSSPGWRDRSISFVTRRCARPVAEIPDRLEDDLPNPAP
jgi:hypothetical protein